MGRCECTIGYLLLNEKKAKLNPLWRMERCSLMTEVEYAAQLLTHHVYVSGPAF
jgi:hypothetical protein